MTSPRYFRWFTVLVLITLVLGGSWLPVSAQEKTPEVEQAAPQVGIITSSELVEPVLSRPLADLGGNSIQSPPPDGKGKPVPGFTRGDALGQSSGEETGAIDKALAYPETPQAMPAFLANFEGVGNVFGVLPPDTNGDIGYDPGNGKKYYVQWVNLALQMWDVTNPAAPVALLGSPIPGNLIWSSNPGSVCANNNDGDPIVLFDSIAHRWVLTQFALPNLDYGPYYECIAISKTANPAGEYFLYEFPVSATKMNDYPKFGVWPDGYYMTANQFVGAATWGGVGVWSFNRSQMLLGQPASYIYTDMYSTEPDLFGMLPADLDGSTLPPAGAPMPLLAYVDADWSVPGYPLDSLSQWAFHVDWAVPGNSTITKITTIPVTALDPQVCAATRGKCIHQPVPGVMLEDVTERLMWRLQYRNNGGTQTMVTNITVDTGGGQAGIRWFELHKTSGDWSLYQEGTYAGPSVNADHRWMGSAALDASGNLALGYSVSSFSVYPSIRVAGRLAGDPLGTLAQGEASLIAGGGSQTHTAARWGDYSSMNVDPVDECTFWYTQEYMPATSVAGWQTRIGAFKFPGCVPADIGTLKGMVTSTPGGAAIEGATIRVMVGPTAWETTTDASGNYSIVLPTGTHNAEASKYGFSSDASSVTITKDTDTLRNFSLSALAFVTVQGTVRDASHGGHSYPLYARLDFPGTGLGPVYTNPQTGSYSVLLAQNTLVTVSAAAVDEGYQALAKDITPAANPTTLDFDLVVDGTAANCPTGYHRFETVEAFSSSALPTGWANQDLSGNGTIWSFDDPGLRGNLTGGTGGFAIFDSDHWNPLPSNTDAALVNPVRDISQMGSLGISFRSDFYRFIELPEEVAQVEVSYDGSSTWTPIWSHSGTDDRGPKQISIDLTPSLAQQNTMQVRFRYFNANWDWWWQVDDVMITGCEQVPGGFLLGTIQDANNSNYLNGVNVSTPSLAWNTIATPEDPALPDGFYRIFSGQTGSTTLTVEPPYGYAGDSATINVANNGVHRQDFALKAPKLTFGPNGGLQVTVSPGRTATLPLTLTNTGGMSVDVDLFKVNTPYSAPIDGLFTEPHRHFSPKRLNELTAVLSYDQDFPQAPAVPDAGDPVTSWASGLAMPWGIGRNNQDTSLWLGNLTDILTPVTDYEYSKTGIASGATIDTAGSTSGWSADMAANPFAQTLWQVNVAGDGCIFEMDLVTMTGTGRKVCPAFGTSQRGLAYNPLDDTFYSGSWNDGIIHHFDLTGHIFESIDVGIAISGLAFNPGTHHLFVFSNQATATPFVYVLDTANGLTLTGSFATNGFFDNEQAGVEMACDGTLWAPNQASGTVYAFTSGEGFACVWDQVPWLSMDDSNVNVPAGGDKTVQVTFDATGLAVGTYQAHLHVFGVTPYQDVYVPVQMVVNHSVFIPAVQR